MYLDQLSDRVSLTVSPCHTCYTNVTQMSNVAQMLHVTIYSSHLSTVLDIGLATVGGSYPEEAPGAALQPGGQGGRPWEMKIK